LKNKLIIDGSMGEGGGQVLRSSLTLAMLLQQPFEIHNIRAGREKPGLLRQHLTCVRAAATICNAKVTGDVLGSDRVSFEPGAVMPGDYHFVIGSAGSTTLVCQTLLLPLAMAGAQSRVRFEGGTHNGLSPSLDFLRTSFLPVLAQMGLRTEIQARSYGFYPAGGGDWSIQIEPVTTLQPLHLKSPEFKTDEIAQAMQLDVLCSKLPEHIGQREVNAFTAAMKLGPLLANVQQVNSQGPGNMLIASMKHSQLTSQFELTGQRGLSAEQLATTLAGLVKRWLTAKVAVEEYLADQLLLPLAVAGAGQFSTLEPSLHCTTNIEVIRLFGLAKFNLEQTSQQSWIIRLGQTPDY
jgi:RNA 3'-terminal phosphate cyclase (ATP)